MHGSSRAALLAALALACCLAPAAAAGRGLAEGQPALVSTKPWEKKAADYDKPLIGILAQVRCAD